MIIVFSTYPDKVSAAAAAMELVEGELAACVSMIKIEDSVYRWKGKVESAEEYMLMIKTTQRAYPQLERRIKAKHPHKVPEIVYVEVKGGSKDYLEWVDAAALPKLLRVPLDLRATRRASMPSSELRRARKPRTLSR